jgi:phage baseplate assembly protein W
VTSSRAAEEDVRQAIRLILETDPGERVMRPDFGAGLRSLVFGSLKHDHRHTPRRVGNAILSPGDFCR